MTGEENYGGALYVPWADADTKGITTETAAQALAEAGLPVSKASAYFRNCAATGLVHPYTRLRTGKKPYLYRADQLVIASILHRVAEAAIGDKRLRHRVSTTLNAWNLHDLGFSEEDIAAGNTASDRPRSPAAWALFEYMQGQRGFSFEIRTCRNSERGTLDFDCRLTHAPNGKGTNFRLDPADWLVRSAFVTDVDNVLAHLTRPREVAN